MLERLTAAWRLLKQGMKGRPLAADLMKYYRGRNKVGASFRKKSFLLIEANGSPTPFSSV